MATKQSTPNEAERLRKEHPNAWIPVAEGDTLTGEVVEVTQAWSDQRAKNGDGFYPLVRVRTDEGNVLAFHAFSVVGYNQVMSKQPLPGERLTITFQGLGKEKNGNNAPKLYHIHVEGRDGAQEARGVYGRLGGAPRAGAPAPVEPDVPADTSDLPF